MLLLIFPEDHPTSRELLGKAGPDSQVARNYAEAAAILRRHEIFVIICEHEFPGGDWKAIVRLISSFTEPPLLIVTSRLADEYLWAEVLNLGGYDVLAQPFDCQEVNRVVSNALARARDSMPERRKSAGAHVQHPLTGYLLLCHASCEAV